ncbi:serine/threonine-protein kinase pelle [Leptinotarsa decemlineata]|uniref:serine/threonine-protein kinase pelle n=1 Tax=Leptinotarsa decemlineata TaxID=7539 RepID=UPI003D30D6A4
MQQSPHYDKFIYEIPYDVKKKLINIFDQNDSWEKLGTYMKYDRVRLEEIKRVTLAGRSPTSELLDIWGNLNHTVSELFFLLSHMKHYEGMTVIKNLVDKQYHGYIKSPVQQLSPRMKQLLLERKLNHIDTGVHPDNFNGESEKILNVPKICSPTQPVIDSKENNESMVPMPRSPVNYGRSKITASDISCMVESAGGIPSIPYEELGESTNNWSEYNLLGKGGFGKVFKGTWKYTQVAIKRLENKEDMPGMELEQIKQSITELHCLNSYRHDNILPLYGYSIGGLHPCLVYQYMAGGSLDNRLRIKDNRKVLKWPARLNVAIGTARGLQFLHTIKDTPLIHGDIKCANILLDANKQPRIGDFGLAREGPQRTMNYIKVSRVHGTKPYLPEEFLRSKKFSTKVDTYSFGVVLFEIATSLVPHSVKREDRFLRDHVMNYEGDLLDMKDPRAEGYDECYRGIMEIGKMCVRSKAKDRPEMVEVLKNLEAVSLK